jgi:hypothetical protein
MRPTMGYPCYFSNNRSYAIGFGFWFNATSESAVCYFTTSSLRKELLTHRAESLLVNAVPGTADPVRIQRRERVENPKAVGANVGSIDCVLFH